MVLRSVLTVPVAILLLLTACSSNDDSGESTTTVAADTIAPPTVAEIIEAQQEVHIDGQAGRWTRVRPDGAVDQLTEAQRRQIRRLESLGYVGGSRLAPTMKSVVRHEPDRARAGLNFYTSGHAPEAVLMDMDGRVLHRWALGYWTVWPDSDIDRDHRGSQHWRHAHILPGGDLLAIYDGLGLVKIDRRSNLIWANHCGAHHDFEVLPDGDIIVLAREAHMLPRVHRRAPVLEDYVLRLGPDGEIKQRVSLLEAFENSEQFAHIWQRSSNRKGDIFHTNSLEMLDGRFADRVAEFTAGRVLISIRNLSAVAVVDLDRVEVVWALQDSFDQQHDATILSDGNLMLFNNYYRPGMSSVDIYDPAAGVRVWQFLGTAEHPFFSRTCGTCQQLPGGNLLITESDNGRAFEIDDRQETVWEFYNPNRTGAAGEYIATLFEMLRLPADSPVDWAMAPE